MHRFQAGYLLGRLGFRGLFVLIGGVFAAAFLAVSAPYLLSRLDSMRGAAERLEAIRQTAATRELIKELQRRRSSVFFAGAGEGAENSEIGRNIRPTVAIADLDEELRGLLAVTPEETSGRKRMQVFAAFGQQVERLQAQIGERLGSGAPARRTGRRSAPGGRQVPAGGRRFQPNATIGRRNCPFLKCAKSAASAGAGRRRRCCGLRGSRGRESAVSGRPKPGCARTRKFVRSSRPAP